jgi:hypothetical protein
MTTQVYFRAGALTTPTQFSTGTNNANLVGTNTGWAVFALSTTQGTGGTTSQATSVAGPTSGIEVGSPDSWISPPLDADVTISGTITFNLWASEINMNDNCAVNCVIQRVDSTGAIASTVVTTARTTEVALTTATVNNFTATPTSTAFNKGDRIRMRVFADDAGTMGSGGGMTFNFDGNAASLADSFVTFNETFGFLTTDPTTTTIYPTDTASDIDPGGAGTDTMEMWTSQGSSEVSGRMVTTAGWGAPQQGLSGGAGSNLIEWFSKPLSAFTLAGPVLMVHRAAEDDVAANASIRAELAVCANNGTLVSVWAGTSYPTEMTTTAADYSYYLAGDDTAITNGQRLRLRVFVDDCSTIPMVTGHYVLTYRSGTANGTYLTFGQTLTEFVAGGGLFNKFTPVPFIPKGRSA